jgi:hypothetical protein
MPSECIKRDNSSNAHPVDNFLGNQAWWAEEFVGIDHTGRNKKAAAQPRPLDVQSCEAMNPEVQIEKVHCNRCGQATKHRLLFPHEYTWYEEIEEVGERIPHTNRYDLLECLGCDDVSLRCTETVHGYEWEEITFFPPRVSRPLPKWHWQLPEEIQSLLSEVYNTLHADGRRLALMGVRAIIERTMILKIGSDLGSFPRNLTAFESIGFLSRDNREYLETALEVGHAATHRAHTAEPEVINTVMDILENLLQAVFVLGSDAAKLRPQIPTRPPKATLQ